MNRKTIIHLILIMVGLTVMTITSGCGLRYNVHGTVIDMDTGQPVEGVVVSIKWEKENFSLPGMGRSFTFLELADDVTGPDGKFKIPKYLFRDYHLAAYKKGYVCWDWEDIFPLKEREGFTVKYYDKRDVFNFSNGMVIEIEPFRGFYSSNEHAIWVQNVYDHNSDFNNHNGRFSHATENERKLYKKIMTENE